MYVYCISPSGKLKSNFIKIGFCTDFNSLKNRYSTYYGSNHIYYYVKVESKLQEIFIHNKFKELKLHIENELFIYNDEDDKCNYNFYKQKLVEFSEEYEKEKIKFNENNKTLNIIDDENEIIKYIDKLTISEKSVIAKTNKENTNKKVGIEPHPENIENLKNDKKSDKGYYNLENAKCFFEESINNKYNKKYTDILLYSILYNIKNNGKEYNELYKMHKKTKSDAKFKKFNQKTKRCNIFINTLETNKINIKITELNPTFFQRLSKDDFKSLISYIEDNYV